MQLISQIRMDIICVFNGPLSKKNFLPSFFKNYKVYFEMKTINFSAILILMIIASCNWAKDKANKTGEAVAKTGSEFADGVAKGIQKTFSNEITVSDNLKTNGLKIGKIIITSTDSTTDNILSAYLIFDKDFDQPLLIKIFDEQGLEYGRTNQLVSAKAGEAKYVDFIFDKRTNIDGKGKISIE